MANEKQGHSLPRPTHAHRLTAQTKRDYSVVLEDPGSEGDSVIIKRWFENLLVACRNQKPFFQPSEGGGKSGGGQASRRLKSKGEFCFFDCHSIVKCYNKHLKGTPSPHFR